jgi:hypothetical protein
MLAFFAEGLLLILGPFCKKGRSINGLLLEGQGPPLRNKPRIRRGFFFFILFILFIFLWLIKKLKVKK